MLIIATYRRQSHDTVLDDGDDGIQYSAGWDSSPNNDISNYFNNTMQYVLRLISSRRSLITLNV